VQIFHKTLSRKTNHKNGAGGVAQGVDPEFKPQYHKKTKKQKNPDSFRDLIYIR
jgi:hypothetical protein